MERLHEETSLGVGASILCAGFVVDLHMEFQCFDDFVQLFHRRIVVLEAIIVEVLVVVVVQFVDVVIVDFHWRRLGPDAVICGDYVTNRRAGTNFFSGNRRSAVSTKRTVERPLNDTLNALRWLLVGLRDMLQILLQ